MRIMMSAAASPVAPSIIRHLQILGHQVIGHDAQPFFHCDVCDTFLRSPQVGHDYLPFLQNFETSYDLYLPFLDEELRYFSSWGEYPANCICSPSGTLLIFTDKANQQSTLEGAGLPVPPEVEVVIKPTRGRGGRGVINLGRTPGFVVQRRIKGQEYTIDVLVGLDGGFLYAVPRERLIANGVSIVGRVVMDDDLIELAQDVVKKFKFVGPINIQVMQAVDEDYIIEVNPRLSGSCMFSVLAGFDILDATVRLFEDKPFIRPNKIEPVTIRRYYMEERV